jgi:RNA polymerase sigma factor for flagellar operon FliA
MTKTSASSCKIKEESKSRETREVILQAISELSEEQREIITLLYTEDLTYKEISSITGKREDAIRQIHSRAIKKLRELYKY